MWQRDFSMIRFDQEPIIEKSRWRPNQDDFDEATWREYVGQVRAAANTFATSPEAQRGP
jgi:hypothetical protein